jgi:coatomer subunit beta'
MKKKGRGIWGNEISTFIFLGELTESVKTGIWVGYCFIFTTTLNRLSYYVGGEVVTIAHMDRPLYLVKFLNVR